jgi:hypothetical protein
LDIIIESIYKPINLLFFNKLDENDINLDYDKFYEKYIFCRKFKNSLYNKFNVLIPSRLFTKIYNNYKKLYLSTLISIIYYKLIIKDDSIIDIEFIKYDNPFIYYSQSNLIGVDINQDNYPSLRGLCIIDNNVIYSTIAQAIYRLRGVVKNACHAMP